MVLVRWWKCTFLIANQPLEGSDLVPYIWKCYFADEASLKSIFLSLVMISEQKFYRKIRFWMFPCCNHVMVTTFTRKQKQKHLFRSSFICWKNPAGVFVCVCVCIVKEQLRSLWGFLPAGPNRRQNTRSPRTGNAAVFTDGKDLSPQPLWSNPLSFIKLVSKNTSFPKCCTREQ